MEVNISQKEIAKRLKRGKSTISEEIKKGMVLNRKTGIREYKAEKAQKKAYFRQYRKKRNCLKLSRIHPLAPEIEKRIIQGQSPESIAG